MSKRVRKSREFQPLKLNNDTIGLLCTAIRKGLGRQQACDALQIARITLNRWLRRAELKKAAVYVRLERELKKAEADFQQVCLDRIEEAARGGAVIKETTRTVTRGTSTVETKEVSRAQPQWTAAAWLLERKHPEVYGELKRVQTDITSGGKPVKAYVGFDPDEWDKKMEEAAKEQALEDRGNGHHGGNGKSHE